MDFTWWLYALLFVVAFLYASVGHGGASGYLALMALAGTAPTVMKPTALILNLFVSLVAFIQFYIAGHFKLKLVWPFLIASVPLAFLGGRIHVSDDLYKQLLGALLLIPAFRFLFFNQQDNDNFKPQHIALSMGIGGIIGFLSGLIGIGGGVLLAPVLILLHWADQKQTAAACALFIFINSIAGLAGQMSQGIAISTSMMTMTVIAFCGGLSGAYFGASRFDQKALKYILATVLIIASIKLLFKV